MFTKEFVRIKLKHLTDKFFFAAYFMKYMAARATAPLYRNKKEWKNLWIISERGTDARDNGFYFFCYLREHHPEINARYIISDDSADAPKVRKMGNTIPFLSFRHYQALAVSEMKISSHIMGFAPNAWFFTKLERMGLIPGIKVFLQHGITKDNVPFFHYQNTHPDLFVCAAGKEFDYVRKEYGHPEGVARLLGFCRYDGLPLERERNLKKTVLVMPTWRQYLEGVTGPGFLHTGYYLAWESFLINPKLQKLLKERGWRLIFYPHMEVQPYLKSFHVSGDSVTLASFRDYDVQRLLIDADILITDYSSVYFDFGYMEKPVLYYQFDQREYRSGHYQEGWFSYERDGLGDVATEEGAVVDMLESLIAGGAVMEPKYRSRVEQLFGFHDHENCRRNYEAVSELWENRKAGRGH